MLALWLGVTPSWSQILNVSNGRQVTKFECSSNDENHEITMKKLSHYDEKGRASMVDVSAKPETKRTATAHAFVRIKKSVLSKLPENPKGNPLEVARFAGISAAKKTSDLVPMCHPLMLSHVDVTCTIESKGV